MAMDKNFDATTSEAAIATAWEQAGAFRAGANAKPGADPFCIMIPPPNVTGSLHMGHAFNNTLQDILVRWHRMRGFDTLWQPGQDHAGIATQMVVERQLAARGEPGRRELGREKFLEKVWEWKEESGGTIIEQLKRLGASCDWDRNAFTMSGTFPDAVIKTFVEMYEAGLIYRGKRLVNWDPKFETAISDLEVENRDEPGHMWHFKYPLAGGETYEYVEKDEDGTVTLREVRDYIAIATTRPETMLGDGAVAVHPDDARYAPIVGKRCEIPVGPKETRRLIPIITDEYPDMAFGSGAVKITGAHDFNDYQVAKRGGIPLYRLMNTVAAMRDDGLSYADSAAKAQAILDGAEFSEAEVDQINLVPDEYRGLDRFEARTKIVEAITSEGLAVMIPNPEAAKDDTDAEDGEAVPDQVRDVPSHIPLVENKSIMKPYGDRSGVVIEPMLTDQWFVDAAKLAGPAMEAVRSGETQILPDRDAKVYFHWMENIEPWCISRQLWWGHQVPVWYGPKVEYVESLNAPTEFMGSIFGEYSRFCASSEEEAIELAKAAYPDGANVVVGGRDYEDDAAGDTETIWLSKDHADNLTIGLRRDPDVLDTWFSSGLWPMGTLGWPEQTPELEKYYPTSVLVTGFDIIFFWVARMMMMQKQMDPQSRAPFHTVYVHALVRDEKGQKMSKSKGNVLDPLDLIDQYGADAVRFTLSSMAAMGRDLKLSTQRIEGYRNFGTKLWNAARFAEMNDATPASYAGGQPDPRAKVNRWIMAETARAKADVDAALAAYRFNDASSTLYAFVWGTVCDWYVEFAKPLFASDQAEETRATMAWVIDQCLILLHPFMPFITEELWKGTAERPEMLVTTDWPDYGDLSDADAEAEIGWIRAMIEEIRSVRSEMNVPGSAKTGLVLVAADDQTRQRFEDNRALVERLARVENVTYADTVPEGAVTLGLAGATICLPLAGLVDVKAEEARLDKALAKLAKEIGGLNGKLRNEKFLAKAPEDIVAEQRDRLAAAEAEADKLRAAQLRVRALA
ncbi:valine--tRNA ligase [Pontivivens nitratireducens]|uniref:Valine--tRNA ligase n=1 Tax=Pontivivens nitratireducens TaxID=2758038 RepID=A0A6G7VLY5_9RHOB|nr:valine--tRNA ligase [Pontibrevibacter nitratireducens]QIK40920.1 valine--tRNA ligase [Pontibrevibacter nitratireducens]